MDREKEFRDFVQARSPALLRSAHALVGDRGHAEDLVQHALMRTFLAWDRVRASDDPYAYTHRILFNSLRRMKRRRRVSEHFGAADDAAARTESYEDRDEARRALDELPARQRAVLVLRFYEDLSVERVAELLGISTGTVKSQTAKALKSLRTSSRLAAYERTDGERA